MLREGAKTHVSGILSGDGALSGGRYRGIAPRCYLAVGKVLNGSGDGTIEHMLRGIEWAMKKREEWNIRILNISVGLGTELADAQRRRLLDAVEEAWDQGIFIAAAAGNSGPLPGTLSPIGYSGKVVAVGCHEGGYFGRRGSLCEHYSGRASIAAPIRKPDIVAPGTDIVSCSGSVRETPYGWRYAYIGKSGTSMATPVVSGAAALFFQKYPELDNQEAKRRMLDSAEDLREPWQTQGRGMLHIAGMLSDGSGLTHLV